MCLTGVDYFSTLSYLPGIAVTAAGALSPVATLLIVILTLAGMLPMYRRIAAESPHGQGSVAMLERLLPLWRGKILVLVLLGFVATSWIITITLSSADAAVHLLENPVFGQALQGQAVPITVGLLVLLCAVFLSGFTEAVRLAVPLVGIFLALNGIVIAGGLVRLVQSPETITSWTHSLSVLSEGTTLGPLGPALMAFPLLVLGLSGFETGVSMMPLISTSGSTDSERRRKLVRNTRFLLSTAAAIMCLFLLGSSMVTTLLIPEDAFASGGKASGRALSYLAHQQLGDAFGSLYDISSILILWFAGASAMAGLINIVPRYLPAYGMAPRWATAIRPAVLLFTTAGVVLTMLFHADVNAQAGAYSTGILAMMTSGTIAVTISAVKKRQLLAGGGFLGLTLAMLYALVMNVLEKPDGIAISTIFVVGIVVVSFAWRISRTTELRTDHVEFDPAAREFIRSAITDDYRLRLIAARPRPETAYDSQRLSQGIANHVPADSDVVFLEIEVGDPSDFSRPLMVRGRQIGEHRVLCVKSPATPNAIAAVLIAIQETTGVKPDAYFRWSEGNPAGHLMRHIILGKGDIPPMVREILRKHEPDPAKRPAIHVG